MTIDGTSGTGGNSGTSGTNGVSGTSGTDGASGTAGTSGNGTSGTSGDGTSGTSGVGTSGTSGATGTSGTGGAGTSGTSGTGVTGTSGTSGEAGATGTAGTSGATGTSGTSGAGGGGTTGVYFVALEFSSGNLIASPFLAAEDPDGNDLLSDINWTFTRNAVQEITITHPEAKFAVDFNRMPENSANNFLTANIGINSTTGNYVTQVTARNSINIKGLSGTFTGINTGASGGTAPGGGYLMYITWTFPSNSVTN
jgi:hypothetical protein